MNHWKKNIVRFLSAQTISLLGSSLVQYAIVWHITLTTSSGLMMSISTICGFLPQVCISLFAGVWVDRYPRKKMIMLADGAIALSTLLLFILFVTGHDSIWLLFVVLAIRSAGTGIQTPAVQAIIPQIVPKEHLMKVSGINSTITSIMMFISPALSGAILSVFTIEATLMVDVITAIIGIGIMFTVAAPKLVAAPRGKSSLHDIRAGFGYIKSSPALGGLLLFMIVAAVLISPSAFLTPLMVSRTFGAEVWRLTASEMTFSLGAVFGGILIATWGGFKNRLTTVCLAALMYGVMMVSMGNAPTFLIYLCLNTLIGITMPCYNSPITVFVQENTPHEVQGRVFSLLQVANSCAFPMGMILFGPLADRISIQTLLICAGIAVTALTGIYALVLRKQTIKS